MYQDYYPGKVALVTGAASGIGFEIAMQFAHNGAAVVGIDIHSPRLEEKKVNPGSLVFKRCDITSEEEILAVKNFVIDNFNKLDIVVNSAGIAKRVAPLEMNEADFDAMIGVNLKGPMMITKHFSDLVLKSENGSIINICSGAARIETRNHFIYSTAKAALEKYTKHIVRDFPQIRSNSILPGIIDTPILYKDVTKEQFESFFESNIKKHIPKMRIGTPIDIAQCVLFLCSDQATYISGASIVIDGGALCYLDTAI